MPVITIACTGFKYTFNNIHPIWLIEGGDADKLIHDIKKFSSIIFFSRPMLFVLFLIGTINLFLKKRIPLFAYLANIIIIIGAILYFILWAPLMGGHDYYFVALLVVFLGIILPFMWFIKTKHPIIFKGIPLKIIASIFLLFNFLYCLHVVKLKTLAQDGDFIMVKNKEFVKYMKWINWDEHNKWSRFAEMKTYIRGIGIKADDKIISLPDESFNISLYLLGQKGWTNFKPYNQSTEIDALIEKGANYLFISDDQLLTKDYLAPFLSHKIGEYKGIKIFRL